MLLISNLCWAQTNVPPSIDATGNQSYCPLSPINIVTDFDIIDPDDTEIDAFYIQISTGYVFGEDSLTLTGSHPNITTSWSASEGKLALRGPGSGSAAYVDLIAAIKDIVFESSSPSVSGDKYFSFTIGDANYLPSTQHYYEYVPAIGITWTDAKTAAEGRTYFGLQGYLATITIAEEAQLTGEQAVGTGWIGGSDAASEGVWKWVTGPENGTIFWNGLANGSTPNYAFWNTGEPNNLGDEDYAHITAPNVGIKGSWNDLSNTGASSGDFQPKGYIVEYGGMPGDPIVNISTSTSISVATISSTTADSRCGSGTVPLSATATSGTVRWFDAASGGTQLGTGSNFTTPTISSTTTFYALASVNGCLTGNRSPVIATVNQIPTIVSVTDDIRCGAGSGTLLASASSGIVNWYNAPTGGTSIGTGSTFSTPSVTASTTYYVDATENGCTTLTRTPVVLNVVFTAAPNALTPQSFCDLENATIADLIITGSSIIWYATDTGGVPLNDSEILANNTTYYATQTVNGCESESRLAIDVTIYETVNPPQFIDIPVLNECDNALDGDDINGFTTVDLTSNATILLNGKAAGDFTITYFTDLSYSNQINNPTTFVNTVAGGQTIYVRFANNLDASCFTDTSFSIEVNVLPIIQSAIVFKNCDEDGIPDGFTDYNLDEANSIITNGDNNLNVTYHLSFADADAGSNVITSSPFNNAIANTVYARVENTYGCHRVSTVDLQVSTTAFPAGFIQELKSCDDDDTIDGLHLFDLMQSSNNIIAQFPSGQNLVVQYYRNLTDAQLEQNEIDSQNSYLSETPFSQTLYVRVESNDNGDCYGIGPHLTLTVYQRPEFEVIPTAVACLNLPPIALETLNPQGNYSYEWTDESGTIIGTNPTVFVASGGLYTVTATSNSNCESFPLLVTVTESNVATISIDDITISDDSDNNSILIDNQSNNLGIGNYEFALDNEFGPYQDESLFETVAPGIHTIFIRDKNSCGLTQIEVSVIGYPKFFTPNNDGYNDKWQVKGVSEDFYPTSLIYIFDRFGKVIAQVDPKGEGWDGYYKGQKVPSTDYWFSVQLIDENGNIRKKRGHFSLIRR